MFTGIVETIGRIVEAAQHSGSMRIGVSSTLPLDRTGLGASIAVDGVCLTVAERRGDRFWADAVRETLDLTTLGRTRSGSQVNLERSLALGDPLGGHLVQGHVDGVAPVLGLTRRGDDCRLRVGIPEGLGRYIALKGSVALHGVSLTVSALDAEALEVALIPETLRRTTLGELRRGDRVNVEVDLLARYLDRLIDQRAGSPSP